jgi:predicted NBD/HSP70 family sugar kinase
MILDESQKKVLGKFRLLGQASKADIARQVDLTPPAVAQIVRKLCDMGYLDEHKEKRKGPRGQPATIYSISERNIFIGVHVGRQRLEFVALGLTGKVLASFRRNVGFLQRSKFKATCQPDLERFLCDKGIKGRHIVGIGIATPYFWEGWQSILPLEGEADQKWRWQIVSTLFDFPPDIPVVVENDGSAAALGELTFGAGSKHRDFLYVNIATFIGGGLIIDGTLRTGAHGNTAALGPFPVAHSTLSAKHKMKGPFELLLGRASLHALKEHAKHRGMQVDLSSWDSLGSIKFGKILEEWIDDCKKALAQFIVGVWSLIDIEAIILDGALPKTVLQKILDSTNAQIQEYQIDGIISSELKLGELGPMAQSIGAGCLPVLRLLGPPQIKVDAAIGSAMTPQRSIRPGSI